MACNPALEVQRDFLECQGRKVSTSFLQNLSQKVAGIASQQETQWHYDLPNFEQPIACIAISLDGTYPWQKALYKDVVASFVTGFMIGKEYLNPQFKPSVNA
ncbi:MAG: hypothetical protein Q8N96_07625 [Methylovulum sp.]|nr:hypothetical protein [Methylovulum sp.]